MNRSIVVRQRLEALGRFRLSARGGDLITFGVIFVAIGLSVLSDPMPQPDLFHTHFPVPLRVFLWSGFGLVAILTAWRTHWHGLGFGLLCVAPAERALSYGWSAFILGNENRLAGTLVYALMLSLILRLAGRDEPTRPPLPSDPEDAE